MIHLELWIKDIFHFYQGMWMSQNKLFYVERTCLILIVLY